MNGRTSLVFYGNVPSKKNSKRVFCNKGKVVVLPSEKHEAWEQEQTAEYLAKGYRFRLSPPCKVTITIYPPTKRIADLTNKAESIMDLLVKLSIIPDDNWHICPQVLLNFGGVDPKNPRAEVLIISNDENQSE